MTSTASGWNPPTGSGYTTSTGYCTLHGSYVGFSCPTCSSTIPLQPFPPPSPRPSAFPHCCPVCKGKGTVRAGFYADEKGTSPAKCRSCVNGIIWGA